MNLNITFFSSLLLPPDEKSCLSPSQLYEIKALWMTSIQQGRALGSLDCAEKPQGTECSYGLMTAPPPPCTFLITYHSRRTPSPSPGDSEGVVLTQGSASSMASTRKAKTGHPLT